MFTWADGEAPLVQGASGRGLGPAFRGSVSNRDSITPSAVSCFHFSIVAFGVGSSRGCGGFMFVFSCPSASYSDHSFKLTMF